MQISFKPVGTCAKLINIELEDGIIMGTEFIDGCAGNAKAVGALVKGMAIEEVVRRLKGITCQGDTSCPDQLAQALEKATVF
jgi:uncharacterized protein (TIGR03905 family)